MSKADFDRLPADVRADINAARNAPTMAEACRHYFAALDRAGIAR